MDAGNGVKSKIRCLVTIIRFYISFNRGTSRSSLGCACVLFSCNIALQGITCIFILTSASSRAINSIFFSSTFVKSFVKLEIYIGDAITFNVHFFRKYETRCNYTVKLWIATRVWDNGTYDIIFYNLCNLTTFIYFLFPNNIYASIFLL